jgi:hypothetical protein
MKVKMKTSKFVIRLQVFLLFLYTKDKGKIEVV